MLKKLNILYRMQKCAPHIKIAGLYDAKKEHLMKGEGTIWDTYNVLTQFASHTTIWKPNDHRRIAIINGAVELLKQEPDIINYLDIY